MRRLGTPEPATRRARLDQRGAQLLRGEGPADTAGPGCACATPPRATRPMPATGERSRRRVRRQLSTRSTRRGRGRRRQPVLLRTRAGTERGACRQPCAAARRASATRRAPDPRARRRTQDCTTPPLRSRSSRQCDVSSSPMARRSEHPADEQARAGARARWRSHRAQSSAPRHRVRASCRGTPVMTRDAQARYDG